MARSPLDVIQIDAQLREFTRAVDEMRGDADLGRVAMVMTAYADPQLNIAHYVARLDELAVSAAHASADPAVLSRYLFEDLGFAGNTRDYGDPRNSFLNEVIDRRLGIPITLSVLFLEVARRCGLDAAGVGLPGHFIVRAKRGGEWIYLDPFHRGVEMTVADCRKRVKSVAGVEFTPEHLQPVDARYVLMRMLNNLKNAHSKAAELDRAAAVIERLLVLSPGDADEVRNLGVLYAQAGRKEAALTLLEWYLRRRPNAKDADQIMGYAAALADGLSRWN
jgi:regulator of sirC expression with transglutaminase-like and TPR domain